MHGEAYPAAHQSAEAAAEFQKILDHRGIVVSDPIGALARLQLGRAVAVEAGLSRHGKEGGVKPPLPPEALAKAKAGYLDFLTFWKDADPGTPSLSKPRRSTPSYRVKKTSFDTLAVSFATRLRSTFAIACGAA